MARWVWKNECARTLLLINLVGIVEKVNEALLPGVYREIGLELHASPRSLGSITWLRSLTQTLCLPLAAYLAVDHDRATVIALGALLWAVPTFCVGVSSTFLQLAVARTLTGVGLAVVIPAIKSLTADATDHSSRGLAFGWLQLTGNIGSALGSGALVLLAGTTLLGIQGWRVSFFLVTILSTIVGLMVHKFAIDPCHVRQRKDYKVRGSYLSDLKDLMIEATKVMKIKTFQVIVAQGVLGSFSWSALAFVTMWLELTGFSHDMTAFLTSSFTAAVSLGGLFGGRLGDSLSICLPNTGRILLAQISSSSGPILAAVLLLALPKDPSRPILHGCVMFLWGFLTSWNSCATNSPIFAEIVPEESRTLTYALDRLFENILASFAPPVVGLLAEKFYGFSATPGNTVASTILVEANKQNAIALGKAIYTAYAIPFVICCMIYTLLYCTYPKDRDKAFANAIMDSESYQHLTTGEQEAVSDVYLYTEAQQEGEIRSPKSSNSKT